MELKKIHRIAFIGNKLNRLNEIAEIIEQGGYEEIYEPFGGSCCISINMMANNIVKKAVANDYDNFIGNLDFVIETNKKVFKQIHELGLKRSDFKLSEEDRKKLLSVIEPLSLKERTAVARYFTFSNANIDTGLEKFRYYYGNFDFKKWANYKEQSKLATYDKLDYNDFINKYKNSFNKKTLLILDPPYLNSHQKSYNNKKFFGLTETINLLKKLKSMRIDFIFFNQIKNDVIALMELLELDYEIKIKISKINGLEREDVMCIVKFN